MNQENLLNKIRQKDAKAFTHGGKFHADDKGKSGAGRV